MRKYGKWNLYCTNCIISSKKHIQNCDREEIAKWFKNLLNERIESPFCENFEDLGETKSCLDSEKCYVGKCKYFKLHIKDSFTTSPSFVRISYCVADVLNFYPPKSSFRILISI